VQEHAAVTLGHGGGTASAWRTHGHSLEQVASERLSTSIVVLSIFREDLALAP
jgi:hypothetical protein